MQFRTRSSSDEACALYTELHARTVRSFSILPSLPFISVSSKSPSWRTSNDYNSRMAGPIRIILTDFLCTTPGRIEWDQNRSDRSKFWKLGVVTTVVRVPDSS